MSIKTLASVKIEDDARFGVSYQSRSRAMVILARGDDGVLNDLSHILTVAIQASYFLLRLYKSG